MEKTVLITGKERGVAFSKELGAKGVENSFLELDVTNEEAGKAVVGRVVSKYGKWDAMVYRVSLSEFARLTGRSLSTFKRDFRNIFDNTPERWLKDRRLDEAKLLIKVGQKPVDIYYKVGFENLAGNRVYCPGGCVAVDGPIISCT